ncbi:unnamed protein product [Paramecium sonneborni]|uniref:Uncharacterized protein n=1 Tax=Paramecium sonneborni TaxID=65129 RepID=A0A8S1RSG5_9CILI|nr:unnamed protein product [Paramecium sonneborni]
MLRIYIKVNLNQKGIDGPYIGMRDFQLLLSKDGCLDKNLIPFEGCFSNNYDCIQGCGNCIKGICQDCLIGWQYQEQIKSCIPECGDKIIIYDEECDDGNQLANDGCHQCKYSCPQIYVQCQHIQNNIDRSCLNLYIEQGYQYIVPFENQFQSIHDDNNIFSFCNFDLNPKKLLDIQIFNQSLLLIIAKWNNFQECQEGMGFYDQKKYVMMRIEFNLMVTINVSKAVKQNVYFARIITVQCVRKVGSFRIMNVNRFVEMDYWQFYRMNNVMILEILIVLIVNINAMIIVWFVTNFKFVNIIYKLLSLRMGNVNQFVETIL